MSIATEFSAAEKDLVKAGSFILGVSAKAVELFKSSEPAQAAAVVLLTDVESFIALAAPAVGAEGLNFAADSAAYAQFLKLIAAAKAFAADVAPFIKSL